MDIASYREFDFWSLLNQPKSGCTYHFPIDFEPQGISFGTILIGIISWVELQSDLGLNWPERWFNFSMHTCVNTKEKRDWSQGCNNPCRFMACYRPKSCSRDWCLSISLRLPTYIKALYRIVWFQGRLNWYPIIPRDASDSQCEFF